MDLRLVGCETIKKLGLRRVAEGLYHSLFLLLLVGEAFYQLF